MYEIIRQGKWPRVKIGTKIYPVVCKATGCEQGDHLRGYNPEADAYLDALEEVRAELEGKIPPNCQIGGLGWRGIANSLGHYCAVIMPKPITVTQ